MYRNSGCQLATPRSHKKFTLSKISMICEAGCAACRQNTKRCGDQPALRITLAKLYATFSTPPNSASGTTNPMRLIRSCTTRGYTGDALSSLRPTVKSSALGDKCDCRQFQDCACRIPDRNFRRRWNSSKSAELARPPAYCWVCGTDTR